MVSDAQSSVTSFATIRSVAWRARAKLLDRSAGI